MNITHSNINQFPTQSTSGLMNTKTESLLGETLQLRILVVDDNLINQKVVLQILKRLGYRADVANNGLEAVNALYRQPYDVIFMDVQMPEMDGIEATRRIRNDGKIEAPPYIIAITGNTVQGHREMCLDAGMDDYLSKPIGIEILKQALSKYQPHF